VARLDVRASARRTVTALPAIVQIVVAVTASYSIAHYGLGHAVPLLAVTITISSLGLARDARPKVVLENAVGILIGIALSEVMLLALGKGLWQVAVVLLVVLAVARFASPSASSMTSLRARPRRRPVRPQHRRRRRGSRGAGRHRDRAA
jgi:uncharacterized membrane protein YgaE (UPF0421/DUF939 family)